MIQLNSWGRPLICPAAHDEHQGWAWPAGRTLTAIDSIGEGLMYYIILFVGVLSFLALVAWLQPSHRPLSAGGIARPGDGTASGSAGSLIAQLLKGERKEDKPCVTPIDCVRAKRCNGNCGHH